MRDEGDVAVARRAQPADDFSRDQGEPRWAWRASTWRHRSVRLRGPSCDLGWLYLSRCARLARPPRASASRSKLYLAVPKDDVISASFVAGGGVLAAAASSARDAPARLALSLSASCRHRRSASCRPASAAASLTSPMACSDLASFLDLVFFLAQCGLSGFAAVALHGLLHLASQSGRDDLRPLHLPLCGAQVGRRHAPVISRFRFLLKPRPRLFSRSEFSAAQLRAAITGEAQGWRHGAWRAPDFRGVSIPGRALLAAPARRGQSS